MSFLMLSLRSMSLPVTLRTLYSRLEEIPSGPPSPHHPATMEAKNERSPPSSITVTNTSSTLTKFSQSAPVPEVGLSVSGSACYAMSVAKCDLPPEINTSPAVKLYPFAPVAAFSHWMTNKGQLSKPI